MEAKLADKLQYLSRLEKEKEEMDKYYSQRWIEEYKRVKNRLSKDFVKKINELEESYNLKMGVMEGKMNEALKSKAQAVRRNDFLESRHQADEASKHTLKDEISYYVEQVE